MRVLVACEESQRVCIEFRKLGHEAYSCDIESCSGGHPEWHIKADVLAMLELALPFATQDGKPHLLDGKWDLIIAHPPCTYLSNAGARFLYPKGELNEEHLRKGLKAKEFFMKIWNADCPRIAVENPIPSKVYGLPEYSQTIQPYEFGHPYSKKTCLWLKGLPKLQPTEIIPESEIQSTRVAGNWFNKGGKDRQKNRAKTFPGIAKAMAEQWGGGNVSFIDDIKKEAEQSGYKIQGECEQRIETELNKLFYKEKEIEKELLFLRSVMTRGQETTERKGLHASAIIVSDDKFCYRQQVLSLFYKQLQGEQVQVGLKRIFSEGDSIHEKWQRLFIRGGFTEPLNCDYSRFDKDFELSYTPDIIACLFDRKMVVEIKSVNTFIYKKQKEHASGKKQLMLYMYLTGIHEGFTLCEDKNTQDFRINYYKFDYSLIQPYIARLERIQEYKQRLIEKGKLVKRHEACTGYNCKMAATCPMKDVCYGRSKERI